MTVVLSFSFRHLILVAYIHWLLYASSCKHPPSPQRPRCHCSRLMPKCFFISCLTASLGELVSTMERPAGRYGMYSLDPDETHLRYAKNMQWSDTFLPWGCWLGKSLKLMENLKFSLLLGSLLDPLRPSFQNFIKDKRLDACMTIWSKSQKSRYSPIFLLFTDMATRWYSIHVKSEVA